MMDYLVESCWLARPEVFLFVAACVVLMIDAFLPERLRHLTYYCIQAVLAAAFFIALPQFNQTTGLEMAFDGHYLLDKLAVISKLFMYVFSILAFAYAYAYNRA